MKLLIKLKVVYDHIRLRIGWSQSKFGFEKGVKLHICHYENNTLIGLDYMTQNLSDLSCIAFRSLKGHDKCAGGCPMKKVNLQV